MMHTYIKTSTALLVFLVGCGNPLGSETFEDDTSFTMTAKESDGRAVGPTLDTSSPSIAVLAIPIRNMVDMDVDRFMVVFIRKAIENIHFTTLDVTKTEVAAVAGGSDISSDRFNAAAVKVRDKFSQFFADSACAFRGRVLIPAEAEVSYGGVARQGAAPQDQVQLLISEYRLAPFVFPGTTTDGSRELHNTRMFRAVSAVTP